MSYDITGEGLISIASTFSVPLSQSEIISTTLSARNEKKTDESKRTKKKAKNRERMREYRRSEKTKRKILQYQVELLTKELHQLLKMHESNFTKVVEMDQYQQNGLISHVNRPIDIGKLNFMQQYLKLVVMNEKLQSEHKKHEEALYKVWGRYKNFINFQLQDYYSSNIPPTASLRVNHPSQYTVCCLPTPPDRIRSGRLKSKDNGQWISFSFKPDANETERDKNTFLFRESTNDVHFRPLSDSMCKKLQAEGYEEGVSFTKVMEQEVRSGKYHVINGMDHFGWKVTYYQITTQEAYPNLTHITDLAANENKAFSDDMVRFEFVKRYTLKPHEDFSSIFTHIREMTWKMVHMPINSAGLRFGMDHLVGRVLQIINDDTCIAIRSHISKKLPKIIILVIMAHQYQNEFLVSMLNPSLCIDRIDDQNKATLKDNKASQKNSAEAFWVTHGHNRFGWYEVGDREYEIRSGGTAVLREYSLEAKILELGELVANWEKLIIKDPQFPLLTSKIE